MALDEALVASVRAGAPPILRLYGWEPACLSLGRNQPARGAYPLEELAAARIEVVRRPTGGRAVFHDAELTYTVIVSDRSFGSARGAQQAIQRTLVRALGELGVAASIRERGTRAAPLSSMPCFAEAGEGEVVAAGRKLIGSAQLRRERVLLQQGSIPLRRSAHLDRLGTAAGRALDGAPAYLESLLGSTITGEELAAAIRRAWEADLGALVPGAIDAEEAERARSLALRYASPEWTWRC